MVVVGLLDKKKDISFYCHIYLDSRICGFLQAVFVAFCLSCNRIYDGPNHSHNLITATTMNTKLLVSSLALLSSVSANNGNGNGNGNAGGGGSSNGRGKKLGFSKLEAGVIFTAEDYGSMETIQVGQCTLTPTIGQTCPSGIAQSFTLTNVYNTILEYKCTCPNECDDNLNAGVGAYQCDLVNGSEELYYDDVCGDVDIARLAFTTENDEIDATECMMDDVGVIRCEENCFCDAATFVCDNVGEPCCAGTCQKVTGPGVKGWELQCLPVVDEEEVALKKVEEEGGAAGASEEWEVIA